MALHPPFPQHHEGVCAVHAPEGVVARPDGGTIRVRQQLRREINSFQILVSLSQTMTARSMLAALTGETP